MNRLGAVLLAAAAVASCEGSAAAFRVEDIYEARVIVTGQGEENRGKGVAEAFRTVLVKASGDPRLSEGPEAARLAAEAAAAVASFHYRDRMEGIPVHDEQGTRNRPYDLTVAFDQAKVDAALRSIGADPWPAERPDIVVFVGIELPAAAFVLAAGEDRGRDQREALAAEAGRIGLPVVLPSAAALQQDALSLDTIRKGDPTRFDEAAKSLGGDLALIGTLTWNAEALGWVSDWRISSGGTTHRWGRRGGSFDQAFRAGLGGAAQILSGNGQPD